MEGNAFPQAVQKAKAAGMKKGDKFKVDGKEYTLQDCENLIDEMKKKKMKKMSEKAKPRLYRFRQRRKQNRAQ